MRLLWHPPQTQTAMRTVRATKTAEGAAKCSNIPKQATYNKLLGLKMTLWGSITFSVLKIVLFLKQNEVNNIGNKLNNWIVTLWKFLFGPHKRSRGARLPVWHSCSSPKRRNPIGHRWYTVTKLIWFNNSTDLWAWSLSCNGIF